MASVVGHKIKEFIQLFEDSARFLARRAGICIFIRNGHFYFDYYEVKNEVIGFRINYEKRENEFRPV